MCLTTAKRIKFFFEILTLFAILRVLLYPPSLGAAANVTSLCLSEVLHGVKGHRWIHKLQRVDQVYIPPPTHVIKIYPGET